MRDLPEMKVPSRQIEAGEIVAVLPGCLHHSLFVQASVRFPSDNSPPRTYLQYTQS